MSNNVKLFFKDDIFDTDCFSKLICERLNQWNTQKNKVNDTNHSLVVKEDTSGGVVYGLEHVKYFNIIFNDEPITHLVICKNLDDVPEADLKPGRGTVLIMPDYGRSRQILMAVQEMSKYSTTLIDVNDEVIEHQSDSVWSKD